MAADSGSCRIWCLRSGRLSTGGGLQDHPHSAAHRAVHQDGPSQSPTSIAAATFQSAARAMRTEFIAAYTAPTELAQQCEAHMTGSRQRQSRDDSGDTPAGAFGRIWTDSGLFFFFFFFFWCLQDGMCEHSLCGSPWACTGAAGRVTIINQQRFESVSRGH